MSASGQTPLSLTQTPSPPPKSKPEVVEHLRSPRHETSKGLTDQRPNYGWPNFTFDFEVSGGA